MPGVSKARTKANKPGAAKKKKDSVSAATPEPNTAESDTATAAEMAAAAGIPNVETDTAIPAEQAKAPAPAKVKKVAIVGFASHWNQAPFDDKEFEIWSLNEAYDMRMTDGSDPWVKPKAEGRLRWFEIHGRETEYAGNPFFHSRNASNEHAAKMAALNCLVYMQKHWDDIPNSVEYPLQAMIAKYGGYYTNSISYMMALALSEGFQEIHIYGVDMAQGSEYAAQRPSCEYFLGIAKAAGVRVYMPQESDLLKTSHLYGWEQPKAHAMMVKLDSRKGELQTRLGQVQAELARLNNMQQQLLGALENQQYMREAWVAL